MKKRSPPLNKKRPAIEDENKLIEDLKLLTELREHYGLDEVKGLETWINLSLLLARDYVPKFQHLKQQGRPIDLAEENKLLAEIAGTMKKKHCTVDEAIKILDKDWGEDRYYYRKCYNRKKTRRDFARKLQELDEGSQ